MIITTCISDFLNYNYVNGLKASCEHFKLRLTTIEHIGDWESHKLKDLNLYNYLKSLNDDDIIVFTDGYDTLFLSDEKEILTKFYKQNCDILFSAEVNCYPDQKLAKQYKESNTKYKYLNSGGFIGYAKVILRVYEQYLFSKKGSNIDFSDDYKWSNQYVWTKIFLQKGFNIKLDYDCEIFQTFSNSLQLFDIINSTCASIKDKKQALSNEINLIFTNFSIKEKRLINDTTFTSPCHLHFNSPYFKNILKSTLLNEIIAWT
jgi:hypothetical protein